MSIKRKQWLAVGVSGISMFLSPIFSNQVHAEDELTTLERIQEEGELRVGTVSYPPFSTILRDENGDLEWAGVDAEIAREIASDLGVELSIIENISSDANAIDLEDGSVDMIIGAVTENE
jgi:ABC-type amino acid transport substrate-binding protein